MAVSIVLVYGEVLLAKLKEMPAKQWFEERKQLQRDFPECSGFAAFDWEWVPGEYVGPITIMVPPAVGDVFIFANYLGKGDHRLSANVSKGVHLHLAKEEIEARSLGEQLVRKLKVDPRRTQLAPQCEGAAPTGPGAEEAAGAAAGALGGALGGGDEKE